MRAERSDYRMLFWLNVFFAPIFVTFVSMLRGIELELIALTLYVTYCITVFINFKSIIPVVYSVVGGLLGATFIYIFLNAIFYGVFLF